MATPVYWRGGLVSVRFVAMKTGALPATWRTTVVTALSPVIWGTTYLLSTEVLPSGIPLTTGAIRTLPAGIALVIMTRGFRPGMSWSRLLVLSFLNIAAFQSLLFVAAQRLPGGIAAVANALQPLMIVFLIAWAERKPPPTLAMGAAFLGAAGMTGMLLSPGVPIDSIGLFAAIAGSACLAVGTFLTLRWRNGIPLLPFIGWKLVLGGLMLAIPATLWDPSMPDLSPEHWLGYAYLSLLGTGVAYALWFRGLARLPPVAVSALGLLGPVTAILLGWWFLDERLRMGQAAGIATVLASVGILQVTSQSSLLPWPAAAPAKPGDRQSAGRQRTFRARGDGLRRNPAATTTNRKRT